MYREKYIQLLNSGDLNKEPQINDLLIGEIAVNHNVEHPFISFKDTNSTEVFKVGTLKQELGDSEYHTLSQKIITDSLTKINDDLNTKANSSDVYNKKEVDNLLSSIDLTADYYTETEIDNMVNTMNDTIATKANSSEVYNKSEVDIKIETTYNDLKTYIDKQISEYITNILNTPI